MIPPIITGISGHPISGPGEEYETTWKQASAQPSDDFHTVDSAVLANMFFPCLHIEPVSQASREKEGVRELASAQVFSIQIQQVEAILLLTIGCIGLILTILNR